MKRIFGLIFVVLFGICGTAGGAVLFFGCSQSQVEKGGGGKFEDYENPNNDQESPSDLTDEDDHFDDDNDEEVEMSSTFNISLTIYTMQSNGTYTTGADQRTASVTTGSYSWGSFGGASIWVGSSESKSINYGDTSISWNGGWIANSTAYLSVTLPESGYPYGCQYNDMYYLEHVQCSSCGNIGSVTSHSCYIGSAAGIWGNYSTSFSVYFARKFYTIDLNIYNPDGVQDYASGTCDVRVGYNGTTYNDVNNEPSGLGGYAGTSITISDIKPASGYYVKSVSTYTYTFGPSSGYTYPDMSSGFLGAISIYMGRLVSVNINILSPSGEENYASGTMNVYYSFNNSTYTGQTNEPITGTSIYDNSYLTISNISPGTRMQFASIKDSTGATLTNSSGSYRVECNVSKTITIQMEWVTYTLTIYYYGGTTRQSNATNPSISAPNCTVSSSGIASGGSATVKHTYTTSSYNVTIQLSSFTSPGYYMRLGSAPTTSTYTMLYDSSSDSYTYSWVPDSNDTIYVYVYQRYEITYSANGGSGTLPTSDTYKYKIHGTALTLGTNSLTKTSYTANGWNTNTSGTGTHYASGGSYTTNASDTLYADWTPRVSTIKVQIKTSTNGSSYSNSVTGGTVSVRYYYDSNNSVTQSSAVSVTSATATTVATNALISRTVTFTPTAKTGYVFVGISTSTSPPNSSSATTFTPTSSGSTYTINVFFKVLSSNQLKYDSTDKYWYFEHGEYPQSYVGTSMNNTLNSASPTKSGEIKYNDGTTNKTIEVYTYNSKRYARLQATSTQTLKMSDGTSYTFTKNNWYWFEVEPIRWRVSDYGVSSTSYPSGWSTYGTYKTNFTVVSDRILTIGAVTTQSVKEGWAFKDSEMYSNISGLNKTASTTNFSANITNKQSSTNYTYYKFGSAGQQDKVVSVSVTEDGVRVVSIEEIKTYLNDYSAKASDMVCFLLGCGTDDKVNYWTRNLGPGLGNGQIVTKAGITKSNWLDKVQGVRLALTMGNGSRI